MVSAQAISFRKGYAVMPPEVRKPISWEHSVCKRIDFAAQRTCTILGYWKAYPVKDLLNKIWIAVLPFAAAAGLREDLTFSAQILSSEDRIIIIITITITIIIIIIINPLTARVVGAPHMILKPVFSIFPCSPVPTETCRTPGLSIPWCCHPTSSSVCLALSRQDKIWQHKLEIKDFLFKHTVRWRKKKK